MRALQTIKRWGRVVHDESGLTLIETLAAIAIIGIVVVALLSGLATASRAAIVADEQTTAESLARTQMDWVKTATYVSGATTYTAAALPGSTDYTGYSVTITAAALNAPDDGIQRITVTVSRLSRDVATLQGYKVNR